MARFHRNGLNFGALVLLFLAACSGDQLGAGECQTQRDCLAQEVCIAGKCSAGSSTLRCTADEQCLPDQFCDIVDRTCKTLGPTPDMGTQTPDVGTPLPDLGVPTPDAGQPPADTGPGPADAATGACVSDGECGPQPQNICVANQCVLGCGETGGLACTGGTTCDAATGHCVTPTNTCGGDGDCNVPTQICEQNMCVFGCGVDSSRCTAGVEVCDTQTGRCVAVNRPCMQDTECNPGPPQQVCESRQCVPGCASPGGIQCVGATPNCNATTGRCEGTPPCNIDGDCGDPLQICVNMMCEPRCDAPGSAGCQAPDVCNPDNGRCVPGGIALGQTCGFDAQCQSAYCLPITRMGAPYSACSTPCGSTSDCPRDFSCFDFGGMGFCISENYFNPPQSYDTPSGQACGTNSCQSGWCNTASDVCLEECSRNSDCSAFGGNCWTYGRDVNGAMQYDNLCISRTDAAAEASCTNNADCNSGICNRYRNRCASHCCADRDCGAAENCVIYDHDQTTGKTIRVCAPKSSTLGNVAIGQNCTASTDCDSGYCVPVNPGDPNTISKCSTSCCSESDCSFLPGGGGRCRPFSGPTVNMVSTLVGLCIPN